MRDKLILIAGMSRGGTNLLWNIVQSHPCLIDTYYEINEIFGKKTDISIIEKGVIEVDALLGIKTPFAPRVALKRIERFSKLSFDRDQYNRLKFVDEVYKDEEFPYLIPCAKLVSSWETDPFRILLRRNDALKYIDILNRSYSTVKIIFLVRNGLAVAEGWGRRGATIEASSRWYRFYVNRYEEYTNEDPMNCMIVRFEDVLQDPFGVSEKIFKKFGLFPNKLDNLRIAIKPTISSNRYLENKTEKEKAWLSPETWGKYVDIYINEAQIDRLDNKQKSKFLEVNEDIMAKYNYI